MLFIYNGLQYVSSKTRRENRPSRSYNQKNPALLIYRPCLAPTILISLPIKPTVLAMDFQPPVLSFLEKTTDTRFRKRKNNLGRILSRFKIHGPATIRHTRLMGHIIMNTTLTNRIFSHLQRIRDTFIEHSIAGGLTRQIDIILSCIQNKTEKTSEQRRGSTKSTVRRCAAQSTKVLV